MWDSEFRTVVSIMTYMCDEYLHYDTCTPYVYHSVNTA